MAKLKLSDGRVVSMVKPTIADQMELERQMKAKNKKYGPKEFQADLKLSGFQGAFAIFATLRRTGMNPSIHEILDIDLEQLGATFEREPGDVVPDDDEEDDEADGEGEQTANPQLAPTGDADASETQTLTGPSETA